MEPTFSFSLARIPVESETYIQGVPPPLSQELLIHERSDMVSSNL